MKNDDEAIASSAETMEGLESILEHKKHIKDDLRTLLSGMESKDAQRHKEQLNQLQDGLLRQQLPRWARLPTMLALPTAVIQRRKPVVGHHSTILNSSPRET